MTRQDPGIALCSITHDVHVQLTGSGDDDVFQSGSRKQPLETSNRKKIDVMWWGDLSGLLQVEPVNAERADAHEAAGSGQAFQHPHEVEGGVHMLQHLETGHQIGRALVASHAVNDFFDHRETFRSAFPGQRRRGLHGEEFGSGKPCAPFVEEYSAASSDIGEALNSTYRLMSASGRISCSFISSGIAPPSGHGS